MAGLPNGNYRVHVFTFGPFELYVDGKKVNDTSWPLSKALEIFKFFVARRREWIPRDFLLELFWPDKDDVKSRNNLHVTMHALKRALEPELSKRANSKYVRVYNGKYCLDTSEMWIDADEFESLLIEGTKREPNSDAIPLYERGLSLYRGEFLKENIYDDWPVLFREHYRDLYFQTAEKLCSLLDRFGCYSRVVTWCRRVLSCDPLREEFHRMAMEGLLRIGNLHGVIGQYEACQRSLRVELGVEPGADTMQLVRAAQGQLSAASVADNGDFPGNRVPGGRLLSETVFGFSERVYSSLPMGLEETGNVVCEELDSLFGGGSRFYVCNDEGQLVRKGERSAAEALSSNNAGSRGDLSFQLPFLQGWVDESEADHLFREFKDSDDFLFAPIVHRDAVLGALAQTKLDKAKADEVLSILNGLAKSISPLLYAALLEDEVEANSSTHLGSYRRFVRRLEEEVSRTDRYKIPFSVVGLSLHFAVEGQFDPTWKVSSAVYRRIEGAVGRLCRTSDSMFHWKGTYAVVLPMTDDAGVRRFLERVIAALTANRETLHLSNVDSFTSGYFTCPTDRATPKALWEALKKRACDIRIL